LSPVNNLAAAIEAILRQPNRVFHHLRGAGALKLTLVFMFMAVSCGMLYGCVLGAFSGGTQLWAGPLKVSVGLLLSALICLPSLYIFSCLAGSRARLTEVVGLVSGLLALMTILLIGFAPVAWVFSQSTESVVAMGALHLVFWLVAAAFGLKFLYQGFGTSMSSSGGLRVWVGIFFLVMLQMTTALRPLVGTAPALLPEEKKFFLVHWMDSLKGDMGRDDYSELNGGYPDVRP
jgi:hypothetical protein